MVVDLVRRAPRKSGRWRACCWAAKSARQPQAGRRDQCSQFASIMEFSSFGSAPVRLKASEIAYLGERK